MVLPNSPRYVIIDVDVGCDDAWAILMMIKAEAKMNIKILGITCVAGNTAIGHVVRNVARVLHCAKRSDIPVFRGAASSLIQNPPTPMFHGVDGLGDVFKDEPDMSMVQSENAVVALHRLVNEFPNQITLVCIGPLTNIALALKTYDNFAHQVQRIYLMGGNHLGIGNTHRIGAEFNFYMDSESAHIVLADAKCPVTVLPWEAFTKRSFSITLDWRNNVLGVIDHPTIRFMNPIEKAIFPEDEPIWAPCDAMIVACLLWPEQVIRRKKQRHCTVELQGVHTRGQMVVDYRSAKGNVTVVEQLDCEACKRALLWTVDALSEV